MKVSLGDHHIHESARWAINSDQLVLTPRPPADRSQPEAIAALSRVTHELNNPLDGVMRFVSLAQRQLKNGQVGEVERLLNASLFGLQRMADIVAGLRTVEQTTRAAMTPRVQLGAVLQQALGAMAHVLEGSCVHAEVGCTDANGVLVNAAIYQVICNLLRNAAEAMPDGGCVRMDTSLADGSATIRITDDGPGFSAGDLPHLFTRHFSTKPAGGNNRGLGLAICREILTDLGGTIEATNAPSGGAAFVICVPIVGEPTFAIDGA